MATRCSMCAGEAGEDAVTVCAPCHRRTAASAHASATASVTASMMDALASGGLRTTAELAVPALPPELATDAAALAASPAGCTWCGRDGAVVKKLLGNGAVSICNECVALCADVLQAELGDGWRGA